MKIIIESDGVCDQLYYYYTFFVFFFFIESIGVNCFKRVQNKDEASKFWVSLKVSFF
jgi:hypothetical protein